MKITKNGFSLQIYLQIHVVLCPWEVISAHLHILPNSNTYTYAITVLISPTVALNFKYTFLPHLCSLGLCENIRWAGLILSCEFKPILARTQLAKKTASNYVMLGVQPPFV